MLRLKAVIQSSEKKTTKTQETSDIKYLGTDTDIRQQQYVLIYHLLYIAVLCHT